MQNPSLFPRIIIGLAVISILGVAEASGQSRPAERYAPNQLNASPPAGPELFEISLGFNYIHLGDASPEPANVFGADLSTFFNDTNWLGLCGDFMANFGHRSQQFFSANVDFDNQRYFYVFGPRVTVWQGSQFRLFFEALAGGAHAELDASASRGAVTVSQNFQEDGFAMALGAGVDWRFSNHLSWRLLQADYVPTNLGNNWQNNFRAATEIVYSFGRR